MKSIPWAIVACLLILAIASGCDREIDPVRPDGNPEVDTPVVMETVDATVGLDLPVEWDLPLSDLAVLSPVGEYPLTGAKADDPHPIQGHRTQKHQLFILKDVVSDRSVALAYRYVEKNGRNVRISARSTAESLIMVNPFFLYTSKAQRDTVLELAREHKDFNHLVQGIFKCMQKDPRNTLDAQQHPEFYELAANIAKEVLQSRPRLSGKAAKARKPYIQDAAGPDIAFRNPTFVYYGAGIHDVEQGGRPMAVLTGRDKLILLKIDLSWFPSISLRVSPHEKDIYDLGNGRFTMDLTRGFQGSLDEWVDWDTPNGRASIVNFYKMFVLTMDLVAGTRYGDKLHTSIGKGCLRITIPFRAKIDLKDGILEKDTWKFAFGVIQTIIHPTNIEQFFYCLMDRSGTDAQKEHVARAHEILGNAANIVDKALTAVTFINESAPFIYDLIFAEKNVHYFVIQEGDTLIVTENHPPDEPSTPVLEDGPAYTGRTHTFTTSADDHEGDDVSCRLDWGDGTLSEWSDFGPAGSAVALTHAFGAPGLYPVVAQAKDAQEIPSAWSDTLWVEVRHFPADIDIRPGHYPNLLSSQGLGDVPIALLASDEFDLEQVDEASLSLHGIAPTHRFLRDVSTPLEGETECGNVGCDGDGSPDLLLKFLEHELRDVLESNEETGFLSLMGRLHDGTVFEGRDCYRLRPVEEELPHP